MPISRRLLAVVLTVLAALTGIIVTRPTPAFAACTSWTYKSGYSFRQDTSVSPQYAVVYVNVGNSCPNSSNYDLRALVQGDRPNYDIELYDNSCDNVGMTLYMHQTGGGYRSASTTGCGNEVDKTWPISSIAYPWVWWLNVNGVNSPNYAFPTSP